MELIIIRHGQSANNALVDIGNREVDPPLTELGKRQAEVLAQYLSEGANHELPVGEPIRNASFSCAEDLESPHYSQAPCTAACKPLNLSLGLWGWSHRFG